MNKKEFGRWGEERAAEYLKNRGYRIVERNYRVSRGEIDLIVEKGDYLVFVEVKTRKSFFHGLPQEAVDFRKQNKLRQIANYYLLQNKTMKKMRFDVLCINIKNNKGKIKHYIDAF